MHDCYSFIFLSDLLIWFGQLVFFLAMGELLHNGFDLVVLNPSDRRGMTRIVLLLLRIKI